MKLILNGGGQGDLVADAIRAAGKGEIGLINAGSI